MNQIEQTSFLEDYHSAKNTFQQNNSYFVDGQFKYQDIIPEEDRVFLEWKDINFFVPEKIRWNIFNKRKSHNYDDIKEQQEILVDDNSMKMSLNDQVSHTEQDLKQIIRNSSGFAFPGQILAILGPSGSGKTSLLNILSGRNKLSHNSKYTGTIEANTRPLNEKNFGKIGAFVQQDDVLLSTFTPLELLRFAAKLKTSLDDKSVEILVESIIKRLRLQGCKNTLVGGFFMKGLSGGEKKRTSIGYELITNPNLLILDEPTSGLDSYTALQIMRLLKSEAKRGMTIICTIHSPSSDIFQLVDRIMILSEGFTIYNGSNSDIVPYFNTLGMHMPRFTNPADFLINVAVNPMKFNNEATLSYLDMKQQEHYAIQRENIDKKFPQYLKITMIGENRNASFFLQFRLNFMRILLYILRNPRGIIALLAISFFMGFLLSSIYYQIGQKDIFFDFEHFNENYKTMSSWLGLAFFTSSDQMMCIAYAQILQVPLLRPVYYREKKAKFYTTNAYFLSGWLAALCAILFYPLSVSLITFWLVGIEDQSPENLFLYFAMLFCMAICGSSFGYFWGTVCDNESQGITIQDFCFSMFNLGAGAFTNLSNSNFLAKLLSYISPVRYSTELLMRRILSKKQNSDLILQFYGYTYGDSVCFTVLLGNVLFYFLFAWLVANIKAKYI